MKHERVDAVERRANSKRHYHENRDKYLAYAKRYRDANPEYYREWHQRYEERKRQGLDTSPACPVAYHIATSKERRHEYYLGRRDKQIAESKAWREANPERARAWREANREKLAENLRRWRARRKEEQQQQKQKDTMK